MRKLIAVDTFDGLPTHPMLVHIPIVLGPLLAAATVWLAIRPNARRRLGIYLAIANLLLVGFLILLVRPSGLFLERELQIDTAISRHEELGQQTILLSVVMFLASSAMAWLGRSRRGRVATSAGAAANSNGPTAVLRWSDVAARSVGAAVAVLVVIWMVRTGHSGGDVVWQGVVRE